MMAPAGIWTAAVSAVYHQWYHSLLLSIATRSTYLYICDKSPIIFQMYSDKWIGAFNNTWSKVVQLWVSAILVLKVQNYKTGKIYILHILRSCIQKWSWICITCNIIQILYNLWKNMCTKTAFIMFVFIVSNGKRDMFWKNNYFFIITFEIIKSLNYVN